MNSTVLATLAAHSKLSFVFAAAILVGVSLIAREIFRALASAAAASRARRLRGARAHEAAGTDVIYLTRR